MAEKGNINMSAFDQRGQKVFGKQANIGGKFGAPQTELERNANEIYLTLLDAIPDGSDYAAVIIALDKLSISTVELWAERYALGASGYGALQFLDD